MFTCGASSIKASSTPRALESCNWAMYSRYVSLSPGDSPFLFRIIRTVLNIWQHLQRRKTSPCSPHWVFREEHTQMGLWLQVSWNLLCDKHLPRLDFAKFKQIWSVSSGVTMKNFIIIYLALDVSFLQIRQHFLSEIQRISWPKVM